MGATVVQSKKSEPELGDEGVPPWGMGQLVWSVRLMGVRASMQWNGPMQFIRAWLRRLSLHGDDLAWEVRTTVGLRRIPRI